MIHNIPSPIQELTLPARIQRNKQHQLRRTENATNDHSFESPPSRTNTIHQYRSLPLPTTFPLMINQENESGSGSSGIVSGGIVGGHVNHSADIDGFSYIQTAPIKLHDQNMEEKLKSLDVSLNNHPSPGDRFPLIKNINLENAAAIAAIIGSNTSETTITNSVINPLFSSSTITPAIDNTNHHHPLSSPMFSFDKPSPVLELARTSNNIALSSSSFEIESSGSVSSPVPYSDLEMSILSPHQPPFDPLIHPSDHPHRLSKRELNARRHSSLSQTGQLENRLFPHYDQFSEFMEERYIRYRPSESQHNNEAILSGKHPFQQDDYGRPKSSTSFVRSFTGWFKNLNKPESISGSQNQSQAIRMPPDLENQLSEGINRSQLDFIRNLKPNSSRSIINPSPIHNSGISGVVASQVISQEPSLSTPVPLYTPKAIPIIEYPLNFEKGGGVGENEDSERRNAIINSLDDDVRDLIDGVDNFLTSCFEGIWSVFVTIGDFFAGLY
ncbi:uncharacterized protein J8A68_004927 [[Candida] subhashii]|uniref:Uncharacterized protein n=1 Tax=[Candida] subhashii TaxID=561895 RepID=A0A8J5QGH1_9ASCO|nr:uncharacterized protein J8A68_004927 [[Candida] subhashii]KAG7661558.1 hypothetical protein J8A68_004927 [[Candida] subhashii]